MFRVLGSYGKHEQFLLTYVLPLLYRIALLGLHVIFLIFKISLVFSDKIIDNVNSIYNYPLRFSKVKNYVVIISFFFKRNSYSKKKVVIVGGGYAGINAAKKLEQDFDVTLVDTKDYYEFTPSRLRTLVEPDHVYKVQLHYKSILNRARIVIDKVSKSN